MRNRATVSSWLCTGIFLWLVLSLFEAWSAHTAASNSLGALLIVCLGFYALPTVLFTLIAGVCSAAIETTLGPKYMVRFYGRLISDKAFDQQVSAWGLAVAISIVAFVLAMVPVSIALVGTPQRKVVGALVLGVVVIAMLLVCVALSFLVFRCTRRITSFPRLGKIPSSMLLVFVLGGLALVTMVCVLNNRLDWRGIDVKPFVGVGVALSLIVVWRALWRWPLARYSSRLSKYSAFVPLASIAALASTFLFIPAKPSEATHSAITERTMGVSRLVNLARRGIDADGDGYSDYFGGPDCDDSNQHVNPGVDEVLGNEWDENCDGVVAGFSTQVYKAQKRTSPPFKGNLLFVIIDTMRADRLGKHKASNDGSLTPHLDALSAQSTVFKHVYAQSSRTPGSIPSMMTSTLPSKVWVESANSNYPQLLGDNLFVQEVLAQHHFKTHWISSHFYFDETRGFSQGFMSYDNQQAKDSRGAHGDVAAPRVTKKAIDALSTLSQSEQPFALFVHIFEPHAEYMVHTEFPVNDPNSKTNFVERYDNEVAFADLHVGQMLAALKTFNIEQHTVVVVVSDHGESFGRHTLAGQPMFVHGRTLYDEEIRVPWIVHVPGKGASTHDSPVMLTDVAPTILDLFGIESPQSFSGRSLARVFDHQSVDVRPAYAHIQSYPMWERGGSHPARMVVSPDGQYKLIHRYLDQVWELYDLKTDPDEVNNISADNPDKVAELKQMMVSFSSR